MPDRAQDLETLEKLADKLDAVKPGQTVTFTQTECAALSNLIESLMVITVACAACGTIGEYRRGA